ncbi:MAG: DNA primase [Gammaproteobacteria bacterium]|nr:MAG: DNA primase [Gammaproteobacteria bacterium]
MPGDKRPLVPWQSLQHHRPSPREVVRWFRRWPRANVGIVTGRISGLVVLDVDPAHGGEASLARLEEAHGPLPETVACRTGGGGRHLYFAHPGGVVRNRAGLAQGLDLRGDGGYVVAPPSVHLSGARYAWESGRSPWEQELAPLPEWLRQRAAGRRGHPVAYWRALVREGVEEGARNSTLASLTGHLLWHGVDPYVALELLLAWNRVRCRPPLPDEEVAKVVASIARLHEREEQEGREGAGGEGG